MTVPVVQVVHGLSGIRPAVLAEFDRLSPSPHHRFLHLGDKNKGVKTNPAAQPDMTKVTTLEAAIRESDDPDGVAEMSERATGYIRSFRWCRDVVEQYVGFAIPGVVGVSCSTSLPRGGESMSGSGLSWVTYHRLTSAQSTRQRRLRH